MAKIDTHMGSVMHPQLLPAYVQLAVEYQVPLMLPRLSEEEMARWGVEPGTGRAFLSQLNALDHICAAQGEDDHLDVYRRLFDSVPAGITHLLSWASSLYLYLSIGWPSPAPAAARTRGRGRAWPICPVPTANLFARELVRAGRGQGQTAPAFSPRPKSAGTLYRSPPGISGTRKKS